MLLDEQLKYNNYGFRFIDDVADLKIRIDSVGLEHRTSTDYYFDGLRRTETGCYLFQYTLSGWGHYEYSGVTYKIIEGQAFLAEIPGKHTYYLPKDSSGWEFIYLMMYGKEADRCWPEIIRNIGFNPYIPKEAPLIKILFNIYQEAANKRIADSFQSSALAYHFLMELCRSTKKYIHKDYPQIINKAIQIMTDKYCDLYGIEEVACELGVSKYHLIRTFAKVTGIPPAKYLSKIRIEKAVELLRHTDLSMEEIARKIGYSNGNYFIKVFKRYVGVSPGEFRYGKTQIPYSHLTL